MNDQISVVELESEERIALALEPHRRWAAYALCDLEPHHRRFARYLGAVRDGQVCAVLLVYSPPSFTSLLPCGDPDGVAAILAAAPDLPTSTLVMIQRGSRVAFETRYRIDRAWKMLRLVVVPADLRPAPPVDATIVALTAADLPLLQRFYATWPESVFAPSMIEQGIYFGAIRDGALVAAAGTHAVSFRHGSGVIGNVFTHPDHRGRGLATAVTGAVTQALFDGGAREVALNVREENLPAIGAYRRLGFTLHEPFWEGTATLR